MKTIKVKFCTDILTEHIDYAQKFNVLKISSEEAIRAIQGSYCSPCRHFAKALDNAGLEYEEENLLQIWEDYTGYVAVLVHESEIEIFYLDGYMYVDNTYSTACYTHIAVKGKMYRTNNVFSNLEWLVTARGLPVGEARYILKRVQQNCTEIRVADQTAEFISECSHVFIVM